MTPINPTEASTLIAGRIASRARMLPLLSNTIGDQIQALLLFSNHRMPATMHPLRPRPSTPPLVRVLAVERIVRGRSLVARAVQTLHNHQDLLRRGRVTTRQELHLPSTNDHTIDIPLPRLRRRLLSLGKTGLLHQQALLRTTPILLRHRLRLHDPLNPHHYLKEHTLWRRSVCRETTVIFVKRTTLRPAVRAVVSKVVSGAPCRLMPSRRRRWKHCPRGRPPRLGGKHPSSPRQVTPRIPLPQPSQRSLASRCSTQS